ncbi:hypothetical protein [Nocardioides sp. B-3]|uniref:hypothetical protein n=1 Tax=Nocardioides sp. B-3 TaxID=2895565 RepID=UPI0021537959|nr:hypothetical protein [Nocardioides sp. B-3]UUZ61066.1 hypothetical protein LP418_10630 [Nocardioides sp. B-3]
MRVSRSSWALIAVMVVLVNMPLVDSTWTRASVERNGVDVVAEVTETRNPGTVDEPSWWLAYRLPAELDSEQQAWPAEVDASAYDKAAETGTVPVRVLEGKPEAAIVEGQVSHRSGLYITLVLDALLLALFWLLWRRSRAIRETPDDEGLT